MFNVEIRDAIKKARLYNYEVAAALGMHEASFSRLIARKELSAEQKANVMAAIQKLKEGDR